MRILHRRIFCSENDVFSVQHRYDLQLRKVFGNFSDGFGSLHNIIYVVYFRSYVLFYQVLITLKLYRAVTTDGLVVVAWDGAVECVYADVENPVIQFRIFQYDLVYRTEFILR